MHHSDPSGARLRHYLHGIAQSRAEVAPCQAMTLIVALSLTLWNVLVWAGYQLF